MIGALLSLLACDTPQPSAETPPQAAKDGPIDVGPIADLLEGEGALAVDLSRLADTEQALWQRYLQDTAVEPDRLAEHEQRAITQAGKTMRYSMAVRGDRPRDGYPLYIALHGGGGAPEAVNDQQWQQMQSHYLDSVGTGIYVAPRGITDEWNLHFDDASYALYDRLIENLILLEGVDADRVYLMGFSAGGDGVYQIAPRMADRFAAVSMSAGHDNGVSPVNLYRLPILLQMGELDEAYDRNKAVVQFAGKLDALKSEQPAGYSHALFLHHDGTHNAPWSDHDPAGRPQPIIHRPAAWLADGDRSIALQDTNAVSWLGRHIRSAWPDRIIWDRTTAAPGREVPWYWVSASSGERVDVEIVRRDNAVVVHAAGDDLTVLLNHHMLDLSRAITVTADGQTTTIEPEPDLRLMAQTLAERGDPKMIFPVRIELVRADGVLRPK